MAQRSPQWKAISLQTLGSRLPSRCGSLARMGLPEAVLAPERTQLFEAVSRGTAVPQKTSGGTIRSPSRICLTNSTSSSPSRPGKSSSSFSPRHAGLDHFQQQALDVGLGADEHRVGQHPAHEDRIFGPPRLRTAADELQLPRVLPGQGAVHAVAVLIEAASGLRREVFHLLREVLCQVGAAEEEVQMERGIAGIEHFGDPALPDEPHEQHLHAAVRGMDVPLAPAEAGRVRGLDVGNPVPIPPNPDILDHERPLMAGGPL